MVLVTFNEGNEAMTSDLIIQDELTLDLIAEVLARMFCCSLSSRDAVSFGTGQDDLGVPHEDTGQRVQAPVIPETRLSQVEDASDTTETLNLDDLPMSD